MTYPRPRYLGETGEVSAFYRPTSTPPDITYQNGTTAGFRNESGAPASMLIHFAPGAPREGYFEGLARWAVDGRPSDEAVETFYRDHDNTFI